ncbi:MAG: hypothetical protein KBG48_08425 [Kofleriaceae bacterium]|nr:hypothetical protein [Kofleriaceae bacterium]MBP9167397.1 hypothetical protein [Kofleriaceae bacterium]MBP9860723.1 hypothetical protein [Kofleriaceae bacterium]
MAGSGSPATTARSRCAIAPCPRGAPGAAPPRGHRAASPARGSRRRSACRHLRPGSPRRQPEPTSGHARRPAVTNPARRRHQEVLERTLDLDDGDVLPVGADPGCAERGSVGSGEDHGRAGTRTGELDPRHHRSRDPPDRDQRSDPTSIAPAIPGDHDQRERDALVAGLTQHRGNVAALARELGVHREQVHRRLRRFAIDPTRFRG